LACDLVGADASAKSPAHPLRWAGSVHRKDPEHPRLARIIEEHPEAEINLEDALAELEGLAILRGNAEGAGQKAQGAPFQGEGEQQLDDAILELIGEKLPNPLPPTTPGGTPRDSWHDWVRIGLAFFRASAGNEAGFRAFAAFSRKSPKHDAEATLERWRHFSTSPLDQVGAGTLIFETRRVHPDFMKKRGKTGLAEGETAEARPVDDSWKEKLAAAIEEMNRRFFVAEMSGKGVIASLTQDEALNRERLVFSREQDIKLLFKHRHFQAGYTQKGLEIWKSLGEAWIEDRRRRTYGRLVLVPEGPVPAGDYNLWRGFGVQPKAGDWPLLHQHLLEIICSGNGDDFAYLLRWRPAPWQASRGCGRHAWRERNRQGHLCPNHDGHL
jgi:hypothetical protein